MPDEPKQQSMTAEMIREKAAAQQHAVITIFKQVQIQIFEGKTLAPLTEDIDVTTAIHALGTGLAFVISAVSEVAAQLAEANSRDREAEIRAKGAEAFVAGIQAELAKAQSLVVPATVQVPRPKR